jgi:hypothetical protein
VSRRCWPFTNGFCHLPNRSWRCLVAHQLPHRSTLSRFRGTLSISPPWKHFASYAQEDLVARKPFASPGGMVDRTEQQWWVVDVDGTRATARQRALPQTELLPAPHRRARSGLRTGYQGRKRGEVVRTRMVVLQAHTHQFLGTFGAAGNGDYRGEL